MAEETDASLLSKKDFSHARALIALALFFPTGIFALFYSLKVNHIQLFASDSSVHVCSDAGKSTEL